MFPATVLASLRAAPDRPALHMRARTVTRGELLSMVRRMTAALGEAGLGPGRAVGMVLSLSPEAYAAHLAAHALGCRVAAARPGWSPGQLTQALDRARLDAVVADVPVDRPALHPDALLARPDPGGTLPVLGRAGDIARLTYTSGSTGQPKACAHEYRAISLAYRPDRWAPVLTRLLAAFSRCLISESLASPVMFTYLGRCLVVGGTAVLLPESTSLPEAIERHRITAALMPPARLHDLLRSRAGLSSLRAVMLGGSPAGPQLLRAAAGRLGPIVWQGYGQGEAGVIAILTPEDIAAGHLASVGRPLPGVDVAIVDGEIRVRSPHRMAGYWDDPEETGEVIVDGWVRTRDLGHLDAGGMLHLTGRARDVILVNAEVCYAGAIERVLTEDPQVAQAYVVGAPDPLTGEAIHAFVVPAGDRTPDTARLVALVRSRLSANSVPKTVTAVRDVPMNPSGKPDKTALLHRTGMAPRG
ncbi:class I adenylate-forming enzyme family protein [Actinoplanes sp. NPDC051513]|uniref:class I adenylate-forming enzyme family protein n=1 Tax=Actinoplanes sp. NPDC051513 TaxID=3363908 RepID=UPI00379EB6D7